MVWYYITQKFMLNVTFWSVLADYGGASHFPEAWHYAAFLEKPCLLQKHLSREISGRYDHAENNYVQ